MSGYLYFVAPVEEQWKVIVGAAEHLFHSYEQAFATALDGALTARSLGNEAAVLRAVANDQWEIAWPVPLIA